MRSFFGISCLAASFVCLSSPAIAQVGAVTPTELASALRSGRPQQVSTAIDNISSDGLARSLYRTLFITAGSEPSSPTEASRIAKAAGFVLLTGIDTAMAPLTTSTRTSLSQRLRELLLTMDTTVSPVAEDFQWRAVELMQYGAAYDYYRALYGKDIAIESRLQAFANAALLRLHQPLVVRNNLSLKLAAALGHTGLLLLDHELPHDATAARYLDIAYRHIETTMWEYQSDSTGYFGYSEGPYYFRYAMMSLLPFFLALDAVSDEERFTYGDMTWPSPLRQSRWQRLFEWIAAIRMPDGSLPPFEDTYSNTWFPEIHVLPDVASSSLLTGWREYDSEGVALSEGRMISELSRTYDFRTEYLLNWRLAKSRTCTALPSVILPGAGYAVFRQGWEHKDFYLGFIGKHGRARTHRSPMGSGHKHANEGAFILASGGRTLAMEPGYHSSSARDSLIFARNHNVILVDGKGADSTSFGSFLIGADAFITDSMTTRHGGMMTIRTGYQQADIERTAYVLDWRFVVLRDEVSSVETRDFTHQIHGNGLDAAGSYLFDQATGIARWINGPMTLSARVSAVDQPLSWRSETALHAPAYRTFDRHQVLRSTVHSDHVVFHSVLLPHQTSTTARFSAITADRHASVLTSNHDGWELMSVVASSSRMSRVVHPTLGPLYSNGRAWHCIQDPAGRPVVWMLDGGSVIERSGGRIMLSSPMPFSALVRQDDSQMEIAARRVAARELRVRIPYIPAAVHGAAVYDWTVSGPLLRLFLRDTDADVHIVFGNSPVSTEVLPEAQTALYLHAPWPNPLVGSGNGDIHIRYFVPAGLHARLALYDAFGRIVRKPLLESGVMATDIINTEGLPAGMYMLRLEGNIGTQQQRILILR
jgi:hypothetical protein